VIIYKLIVIVFLLVILQNNKVHGTFIKLKLVRNSADKLQTSAERLNCDINMEVTGENVRPPLYSRLL
jgi:hypothetical protein